MVTEIFTAKYQPRIYFYLPLSVLIIGVSILSYSIVAGYSDFNIPFSGGIMVLYAVVQLGMQRGSASKYKDQNIPLKLKLDDNCIIAYKINDIVDELVVKYSDISDISKFTKFDVKLILSDKPLPFIEFTLNPIDFKKFKNHISLHIEKELVAKLSGGIVISKFEGL